MRPNTERFFKNFVLPTKCNEHTVQYIAILFSQLFWPNFQNIKQMKILGCFKDEDFEHVISLS